MKKWLIFALALCLGAVMVWKSSEKTATLEHATVSQQKAAQQETLVDWGVTMVVKNATPSGCTLEISQLGGKPTGEVECGEDYHVQALTDDGWHNLNIIIDNYAVPAIAYIVSAECPRSFNLNWEYRYGVLLPGTYRVAKEFMDFRGTGDYDEAYHFSQPFVIE